MSAPQVKGWCPGAHRPMMSGDGLVVRIRPRLARLGRAQALGLCDLAGRFGSGLIDLTNRANLQIRGVDAADHDALLQGLAALDLLDVDPAAESRRNILVSPFWKDGDLTHRLTNAVLAALPDLPDLPAKVGFAVDTGAAPILSESPADFRFEHGPDGLLLRADGAPRGRPVTEATAIPALIELAQWFDTRRDTARRRMPQVTAVHTLPPDWTTASPFPATTPPEPGAHPQGALLGAAFGQIDADELAQTLRHRDAPGLRITPWRLFLLEGAGVTDDLPFITTPNNPGLRIHACAGAPFCPQSSVQTRPLPMDLARKITGTLHVSGCAKGCAHPAPAPITLTAIGPDRFDLAHNARAGDATEATGLSPDQIKKAL